MPSDCLSVEHVVIIANPAAGRHSPRVLDAVSACLGEQDVGVDVIYTERPGHATDIARQLVEDGAGAVFASGGDGTLNEVINGLALTDVPFGVIPRGTANVFAHEINLPRSVRRQLDVIRQGRTRRICLGKANGRFFLSMAGAGFDAQVVDAINTRLKDRIGKLAYVVAGLQALWHLNPPRLTLETPEETLSGYHAIIGNGRHYAGSFKATPRADIGEPLLDICLFHGNGRRHMLKYALGIALNRHVRFKGVSYHKASRVHVTTDTTARMPLQLDGDPVSTLPADVSVVPDALTVLVPG